MRLAIPIVFAALVVGTVVFGLMMFPKLHENVEIPIIPLIGLASWLFGRRIGLILIFPVIFYSYILSSVLYTEMSVYYEGMGIGTIILVITSVLIGSMRENYDALRITNSILDERVAQRNAELSHLITRLLNESEATRLRHGQILHDGIGQQLTGIQLYCSSLAEQMTGHSDPIASLAVSIRTKAETAHHMIRKTARLLFPIRIHDTGLVPAINELASSLNALNHLSVDVTTRGDYAHVSDTLLLALYRICHESALCAATALGADTIHLVIDSKNNAYTISLQHNGMPWSKLKDNMEQRLILYRLDVLGGLISFVQNTNSTESIIYRIAETA